MKIFFARRLPHSALAALALTLLSRQAAAAGAGGITEWETPLQKVVQSITGPVAFSISVIGIVVAGAMLIWGVLAVDHAGRFHSVDIYCSWGAVDPDWDNRSALFFYLERAFKTRLHTS